MSYKFRYCQEFNRMIPGVLIDSRASIPQIKNQIGVVIKQYTDSQVSLVTANVLPYTVNNSDGNLSGYFTLIVNPETKNVAIGQFVLRPAFKEKLIEISSQISTFIISNLWQKDYLF